MAASFSRCGLVLAAELLWRDGLQDFEQHLAGRVILERVAIVARARDVAGFTDTIERSLPVVLCALQRLN